MKTIRTLMPDGTKWDVPAHLVADHRAKYYAKNDTDNEHDYAEVYRKELEFTLGNSDELIDWACNNMDWDMVKDSSKKVSPASVRCDYQDGWVNGPKTIEEIP